MRTKARRLAWTLAASALVAPVWAQDPAIRTAEEPVTLTASGSIVSSTQTSLVIKSDDGSRKTFVVDAESILPEKVTRGDRVTVTYETKGTRMRAVSVDPTDSKPPATTPKARPTRKSPPTR